MSQISGCVLFGLCEPFVAEGGAEMVSTFDLFGESVPFNQVQCEGENNFHLSQEGGKSELQNSQTCRLKKA